MINSAFIMKNTFKNFFYSLIDLLTFRKGITRTINDFKIKFEPKWSRYYSNGYESDSYSFFRKSITKGSTILDIGAHIGLYSVPFSQLTGHQGKVYCFEPTPSTFKVLCSTIRLNNLKNVIPVNYAVSDKTGSVRFNLTTNSGEGSNANSIVNIDTTKNFLDIQAYSIDDFRKAHDLKIDVLKIDVEGVEFSALKGANETFMIDRPIGILALHPNNIVQFGHSLENIWDLLMMYQMNVLQHNIPMTKEQFCAQRLLFDIEFKPI